MNIHRLSITIGSIILSVGAFSPFSFAATDYSYILALLYYPKTHTFEVQSVSLGAGEAKMYPDQLTHGYTLSVLSQDKAQLYSTLFAIPGDVDATPQKEDIGRMSVPLLFSIPYFGNAQSFQVLSPERETLLSIPIPSQQAIIDDFLRRKQGDDAYKKLLPTDTLIPYAAPLKKIFFYNDPLFQIGILFSLIILASGGIFWFTTRRTKKPPTTLK